MKARIHIEKDFAIGDIDPRLYSSFIEHLGRAVYGGIYEPGHPKADARGFRQDVLELVRELAPPLVRYPGGNYVCTFDWEDSVGRVEARPRRLDPAWRSLEPNSFGLGEFMAWSRAAGTEPLMALNLATRGVDAARALLEYCNFPGGTRWSDLRKAHGSPSPFAIKHWCLGNEMDGPWQVGQKKSREYGKLANECAKAMRLVDPSIELVACGSSNQDMPSFPAWDAEVLEECYPQVDYLSLHSYYGDNSGDLADYLASGEGMEAFIRSVIATCDHVKAKARSGKTLMLSFDEWNVWYHTRAEDRDRAPWQVGPHLLEDAYTFEDALVVGGLLIALLKHADRVKIACIAQLVNVIAPIMTENGGPAWRQTIHYPFLHASRHGRGRSLDARIDCPAYDSASHGKAPYLSAAVVENEDGEIVIFALNRSPSETMEVELAAGGFGTLEPAWRIEYTGADGKAVNTADRPGRCVPRERPVDAETADGATRLGLEPLSWNVIAFRRQAG